MKTQTARIIKKTVFWASVLVMPGGGLLLLYTALNNKKMKVGINKLVRSKK